MTNPTPAAPEPTPQPGEMRAFYLPNWEEPDTDPAYITASYSTGPMGNLWVHGYIGYPAELVDHPKPVSGALYTTLAKAYEASIERLEEMIEDYQLSIATMQEKLRELEQQENTDND